MKLIDLNSELTIDEFADAAYLYINKDNKEQEVVSTSSLLDEKGAMINIDYCSNGEVKGIEFIPGSSFFNQY